MASNTKSNKCCVYCGSKNIQTSIRWWTYTDKSIKTKRIIEKDCLDCGKPLAQMTIPILMESLA